jgi:hypothetical protein
MHCLDAEPLTLPTYSFSQPSFLRVDRRVVNVPVHCLELELFCCRCTKIMKPPEWYDVVRYHIVPPVFLVVFTVAVQYLAHVGQEETTLTWRLAASTALGNSFSWGCVGLFSLWAVFWLQVPSGLVHGPSTLFGYRPPYQVRCKRQGPRDQVGYTRITISYDFFDIVISTYTYVTF